jgi:hypothetical protein
VAGNTGVFFSNIAEGRRKKEEGRRKKEETIKSMVWAIKKVLTLLAVAIYLPNQYRFKT